MGGKATESKMTFWKLLSHFSQQMAMKGTSAGTSADLLLMVRACTCVPTSECVFFFEYLRHLTETAAVSLTSGVRGQVETARRATEHPREID